MRDLRTALDSRRLDALRQAYDTEAIRSAMAEAVSSPYPPLGPWNKSIESTFYATEGTLKARDRERCLIAILTLCGPQLSLAIHVYWALMEGLSIDEICHVVGLAACYGGVPRLAHGLPVVDRVVSVLTRCADAGTVKSPAVLAAILEEFSVSLG